MKCLTQSNPNPGPAVGMEDQTPSTPFHPFVQLLVHLPSLLIDLLKRLRVVRCLTACDLASNARFAFMML